jgi:hypothetical protein
MFTLNILSHLSITFCFAALRIDISVSMYNQLNDKADITNYYSGFIWMMRN